MFKVILSDNDHTIKKEKRQELIQIFDQNNSICNELNQREWLVYKYILYKTI